MELTEKLRPFLASEGRIVNVASQSGTSAISRLENAATKQCLSQPENLVTKHDRPLEKFLCACTRQFMPHTTSSHAFCTDIYNTESSLLTELTLACSGAAQGIAGIVCRGVRRYRQTERTKVGPRSARIHAMYEQNERHDHDSPLVAKISAFLTFATACRKRFSSGTRACSPERG